MDKSFYEWIDAHQDRYQHAQLSVDEWIRCAWEAGFIEGTKFILNQQDYPQEFMKIINDNFFELLS